MSQRLSQCRPSINNRGRSSRSRGRVIKSRAKPAPRLRQDAARAPAAPWVSEVASVSGLGGRPGEHRVGSPGETALCGRLPPLPWDSPLPTATRKNVPGVGSARSCLARRAGPRRTAARARLQAPPGAAPRAQLRRPRFRPERRRLPSRWVACGTNAVARR